MTHTDIIYGVHPVLETLRSGRRSCHEVFIASGRKDEEARLISEEASRRGVPVRFVDRADIGRYAGTSKHQGVAARVDPFQYAALEDIVDVARRDERKGFIVLLDGVTDPHNVGSLIRTAHLMGAHGMILPRDNAAPITPVVVKVSAGATEHLPIAQVTNISNAIKFLKENDFWIAAAEASADKSLYLHDFTGYHVALILGAEGTGIRRLVRKNCDYFLSIPMEGAIASHNVAVAGALFMGEVARQRWMAGLAKVVPNGSKCLDKE
jgi:23S rRNA (guanosine2251-2'-O)-methyltransferase